MLLLQFLYAKDPETFFLFSLLTIFLYNVSGIGICIEHAKHKSSISQKADKSENDSVSKDDDCHCALHFQMNNVLCEETVHLVLLTGTVAEKRLFLSEEKTCYQLLDYFSSRAPPHTDLA